VLSDGPSKNFCNRSHQVVTAQALDCVRRWGDRRCAAQGSTVETQLEQQSCAASLGTGLAQLGARRGAEIRIRLQSYSIDRLCSRFRAAAGLKRDVRKLPPRRSCTRAGRSSGSRNGIHSSLNEESPKNVSDRKSLHGQGSRPSAYGAARWLFFASANLAQAAA
jgi:hypothetical protein